MPTDEELEALEAKLDPEVRIVIGLFRKNNETLLESIAQLKAQNAELRRMLFGARSEKMPSMASEVRRAMDAEELVGLVSEGADAPTPVESADADSQETKRRKRGRKRSE